MKKFYFGKRAVSPVIGTILMVAVTVIMAAIVGGFVYQTARPKVPPAISTSLSDDPLLAVGADNQGATTSDPAATAGWNGGAVGYGNRVAKLFFEGGTNIAIAELSALVTYTTGPTTNTETTVILDGVYWDDAIAAGTALPSTKGNLMGSGTTASNLWLSWVDSDGSGDITPGDRLDFYEVDGDTDPKGVEPGRDFTVKILHKATQAFVADHTIRVY